MFNRFINYIFLLAIRSCLSKSGKSIACEQAPVGDSRVQSRANGIDNSKFYHVEFERKPAPSFVRFVRRRVANFRTVGTAI